MPAHMLGVTGQRHTPRAHASKCVREDKAADAGTCLKPDSRTDGLALQVFLGGNSSGQKLVFLLALLRELLLLVHPIRFAQSVRAVEELVAHKGRFRARKHAR